MKFAGFVRKVSRLAVAMTAIMFAAENVSAAGFGNLAPARIENNAFIRASSYTLAPFALIKFCISTPDQCNAASGPEQVEYSSTAMRRIMRLNRSVNASLRPQLDAPGKEEWRINTTVGDCNDYAVIKRKKLIDAGFAPAAIRLAVARTQSGEGHAVVVIRTSKGDLVLDNRTNAIRRWNETDLTWVKIQSGREPKRWLAI